ncbi:hypothetical protein [Arthrobacter sp. Soil782]|nr:hypothetical protein [Arthrobacter sp. Soil782]
MMIPFGPQEKPSEGPGKSGVDGGMFGLPLNINQMSDGGIE